MMNAMPNVDPMQLMMMSHMFGGGKNSMNPFMLGMLTSMWNQKGKKKNKIAGSSLKGKSSTQLLGKMAKKMYGSGNKLVGGMKGMAKKGGGINPMFNVNMGY